MPGKGKSIVTVSEENKKAHKILEFFNYVNAEMWEIKDHTLTNKIFKSIFCFRNFKLVPA